jgi:hypothetical protein
MWIAVAIIWGIVALGLTRDSLRVFGWSLPWLPTLSTTLIAWGLIALVVGLPAVVTAAISLPITMFVYAHARRRRVTGARHLLDVQAICRFVFKAGDLVGLGSQLRTRLGPAVTRPPATSGRPVPTERLADIGLEPELVRELRGILDRPNGLFLIGGPPGSGKTTTAYAALRELDFAARRIVTVENTVEQVLPGAWQREANAAADLSLAHTLEIALRLDPDVLMVGDLSDVRTAEMAVQESLQGRLVIATVRARDTADVIGQLIALGIPPLKLQAAVIAVFSQRLIRLLCRRCKVPARMVASVRARLRIPAGASVTLYAAAPAGCAACSYSGYETIVPIGEVLMMAGRLREALSRRLRTTAIRDIVQREAVRSIGSQAAMRAMRGDTSLEEARRATR